MKTCLSLLILIFLIFSSPFDLFAQEGIEDEPDPSDREKAKTALEEESTGQSMENLEDVQLRLLQQVIHEEKSSPREKNLKIPENYEKKGPAGKVVEKKALVCDDNTEKGPLEETKESVQKKEKKVKKSSDVTSKEAAPAEARKAVPGGMKEEKTGETGFDVEEAEPEKGEEPADEHPVDWPE